MSYIKLRNTKKKIIALVDCNSFYVSCERLFNPILNRFPVVVLSNNDGCVISRSKEAKEIGIRKALGARRVDIFLQFLIEAILISILGGIVGIILGLSFGNVVAIFLEQDPVIPYEWVFYSLQICASMGIIFGLYPAIKASKLNPIDSMRYD